jgi:hypothetical protein
MRVSLRTVKEPKATERMTLQGSHNLDILLFATYSFEEVVDLLE